MKTALAKPRTYVPENMVISWDNLKPLFKELLEREIKNISALEKWMKDRNELEAVLQEDKAWRYIHMTCHTNNEEYVSSFQYFATEIDPKIAPINNELDKKLIEHELTKQLDEETYFIYLRKVRNALTLFREENIPLFTEIELKQQAYQTAIGNLMVHIDGKEYTVQQATARLLEPDRSVRETAWHAITSARLEQKDIFEQIFSELLPLRHQLALNAGFDNFRDYMFAAMGRFDYNVADCEAFHQAVAEHVVPILKEWTNERRADLNIRKLQPWDMQVNPKGLLPLKPFENDNQLIDSTEMALSNLNPYLGHCISTMRENNLFDVGSRKGKAPGGYNYPLYESGAPFIFMNATGTMRDVTTMVHEAGHAVHTFLSSDLMLNEFKDVPSEVAELASMSMELISMDQWHHFLSDPKDLARAKKEQLEQALGALPWIATIDKFQHWLYTNPTHSIEERSEAWVAIFREFGGGFADWSDHKEAEKYIWHKQIHIYEVPFYYIEYGFAQLGAISIWKNFKKSPDRALSAYLSALKLGYTKTIGEIYKAAGISFDFSADYVAGLAQFTKEEANKF